MSIDIRPYIRTVNYYETDRMQITHHSNYIRFMEEARVDFFEQIGKSYREMEEEGINSPVVNVSCDFKKPTDFNDVLAVHVSVSALSVIKFSFKYEIKRDDEVVAVGSSTHCILGPSGRPANIQKTYPEIYEKMKELLEE